MKKETSIDPNWPILLSDIAAAFKTSRSTVDTWTTRGLMAKKLKYYGRKLRYTTVKDAEQFFEGTKYEHLFKTVLIGLLSGQYSVRCKWYPMWPGIIF